MTINDVTGGQCRPLQDAIVDVWQCDAQGIYSGVQDGRVGFNTVGQKFLRGVQTTNAKGVALFTTIYPGWYPGRTVHIHFKVRTKTAAGAYEFTSQWYFDEALNERILADQRYAKPGRRDRTNATDSLYRNGGDQLLLAPTTTADGLAASYTIGLDRGRRGRPPGRRPRPRKRPRRVDSHAPDQPAAFRIATRGTSREINRQIALNLVREKQLISRADLARLMGCAGRRQPDRQGPAPRRLVFEDAKGESKGGRRPTHLYLETRQRCALAVDINASQTADPGDGPARAAVDRRS